MSVELRKFSIRTPNNVFVVSIQLESGALSTNNPASEEATAIALFLKQKVDERGGKLWVEEKR